MTKAQEYAVRNIRAKVEKEFLLTENYEIKEWKVEENEYFVSVVFETGLKNDEGTWASILGRDRGQVFIGKKGGLTYYNRKGTKKRLKPYLLHTLVYDQKY